MEPRTSSRALSDHDAHGARPIHVLHVRIVSGTGGGPEKTIFNSPRHLVGTRYHASAAYLHAPDDPGFAILEERARERDCPLISIPDPHPFDVRTLARMSDLCRDLGVTIWHGHDYKSNLFGVLLRQLCGLKLVTTVHGWVKHTAKTPLYFAIDRFALRRYDEVIAVSSDLHAACLDAGVDEARLTHIPNAIDTEEFARTRPPSSSPLRADRGTSRADHRAAPDRRTPSDRLVIGAVGRLSEEKGFHLLIEAVEDLIDRGADVELWIAGEGDQEARLKDQIERSRHSARLRFLGFQADVRSLFEAFDVFCLSSLREGLPNVVLEAMAMEVPVVATRAGGMGAFARDGEDAVLVDSGSADALSRGLERVVRDASLQRSLASCARARIERDFGFRRRMERVVAVYDRVMST